MSHFLRHLIARSPVAPVLINERTGAVVADTLETAFDSGLIQPCGTWEFTFLKAGTFAYYCKEDRSMSGKIFVSPSK